MLKNQYDAIVVGSGPNGLAAAITLRQEGLSVLLVEGKSEVGGGLGTEELTLPGFWHDVSSAVHPMAAASPFFQSLPLAAHGLTWIHPPVAAAHPLDSGTAAVLKHSLTETAEGLGKDAKRYLSLIGPIVRDWPDIAVDALGPLSFPSHPFKMARFGLKAMTSASFLAGHFKTVEGKALWSGMAAHAIQPLTNVFSSAIGLVLMSAAHLKGWPVPQGGSRALAHALHSYYESIGGETQTGFFVKNLGELPAAKAILFDTTPRQLLQIAGDQFSKFYRWQLDRYRYGMGVFKVDWALTAPIPWKSAASAQAGTVHLGNSLEEITAAEALTNRGGHPDKPFVLLTQSSLFDPSRAPEGKHTAYAYCHVPNGSQRDMTAAVENQVERFAPGFIDVILERRTMDTLQLEAYNPNLIGGDINGGIIDVSQLFTRPAMKSSPYRTSSTGIYICSSSTPPGGGVHGMSGYNAAKTALSDIFNVKINESGPQYPSPPGQPFPDRTMGDKQRH